MVDLAAIGPLRRHAAPDRGGKPRRGRDGSAGVPLAPVNSLDGFGNLVTPTPVAQAIKSENFEKTEVGPTAPPGYYGAGDYRRALNLSPGLKPLQQLKDLPAGVVRGTFKTQSVWDLKPWLLLAALILLIVDGVVSLTMRGLTPDVGYAMRRLAGGARRVAPAILAVAILSVSVELRAQTSISSDEFILKAVKGTHLAYVKTGDPKSIW